MDDWNDDIEDDPYFWRFRRTKPREVKGGIRAQTKQFGKQWWAVKWLEAIEKFGPARRVARGRSYARKGQVVDLEFEPGRISAVVQGSRNTPYDVEIFLEILPPELETKMVRELQTQPIYAATLLTGDVHPDIETLFRKQGVPLFPAKSEGRNSTCSCPDTVNPCKHIAAVYYLISQELERDPFLLLHLRGIPKGKLIPERRKLFSFQQTEALPADPRQFWKAPRIKEISIAPMEISRSVKPPILQRLGHFPFWRGELDFMETLERIYEAVRKSVNL